MSKKVSLFTFLSAALLFTTHLFSYLPKRNMRGLARHIANEYENGSKDWRKRGKSRVVDNEIDEARPAQSSARLETAESEGGPTRITNQLHGAVIRGDLDSVRQHLRNGDNPDEKENSHTALHYAALNGKDKIAIFLLNNEIRNASVNADSDFNNKPLHFAAGEGHTEIVSLLLENNAQINPKNKADFIPLHFATRNGHLEVVKHLLRYNADIKAETKDGKTPLQLAIDNQHEDVVAHLRSLGAPESSMLSGLSTGQKIAGGVVVIGSLAALTYYLWSKRKKKQQVEQPQSNNVEAQAKVLPAAA